MREPCRPRFSITMYCFVNSELPWREFRTLNPGFAPEEVCLISHLK